MEWKADLSEINGLRKWYGKQPSKMRIACAQMLNHFAFGTRTAAIAQIGKVMTVRNPRFVAGRMQVTKASTASPVSVQRSITGSVATARFSGWTEQEKGTSTQRKRFATLAGRSGDKSKQVRQVVRLKPGAEVITIDSAGYRPRGGSSNYGGFIAMLMRKGENRLVRIKGVLLKRGKIELQGPTKRGGPLMREGMAVVQVLKRKQPKRIYWLRQARAIYFKSTNLDQLWAKTAGALMGKPGKR